MQASRKSAKAVACKDGIATEFGWQGAQRKGSRQRQQSERRQRGERRRLTERRWREQAR